MRESPKTLVIGTLAALGLAIAGSLAIGAGGFGLTVERLPRTLAAMLVGGGLALSGTMLQCVTRNPLAEPGLLGVNAGGVLGMAIGLAYFGAASVRSFMLWSGGGAFVAAAVVLGVGTFARRITPAQLILLGVATTATLGGIANGLLMAHATALDQFRFWNLGSLAGVRGESVGDALPLFGGACLAVLALGRWLSVLQLGEDQAKALGVPTVWATVGVWLTTAVLSACALAVAGPVTFGGFLAAYLARSVAGPRFALQLTLSFSFGMTLLLVADALGRWVIRPFEIPVGVVIALVGTPLTVMVARTRFFQSALAVD
jgi:iron complex transport system permease protein